MERRKDSKNKVLRTGESERKDGTYMYRYKDLNGDRKCIYAKTLNDLRKKEAEINKDLQDGIYSVDYTLNQLFDRYLEQKVNIKPRTKHKYKTEYDRWVRNKWIGKKSIKSLVKSDIVMFYKELKEAGFSDGTIRVVHKYINGSLEMATEDDMIRRNFATKCIEPYKENNKRESLTKEETKKFLTAAENMGSGRQYLLGFKLMLQTGLRIGEVTGLTWNDIDFKNKTINVNHQFIQGDENSRTAYHIDSPKTFNGKRIVPMSDDVYNLLKTIKQESYFESYKFGTSVDGYSGFVLHTRTGLPILTARFNDFAREVVNKYNSKNDDKLPNISCHICRHTFCTRMAEKNMNINALQKIMGHGSYKTTASTYITVKDDFVNEEFDRVMKNA